LQTLRSFVKRTFRGFGLDLTSFNPQRSADARFMAMLAAHRVNLIMDVGANIGQFALEIRQLGYRGRIVSFEPLTKAWSRLKEASAGDPIWEIAPRAALGAEEGEVEINISANLASSSVLPMLDTLAKAAPQTAYIGTERVPQRRLDDLGASYLEPDSILLIKIDTQGFEHQVLKGSQELLKKAAGLHLEVSLVPLYEGEYLFDDMIAELKNLGFQLWGIEPIFADLHSGRLFQADATFFRS
jgi:FkbM family methyltransferase